MRLEPFLRLLAARIREPLREPEVVFWIFVFPVLLAVGLGLAFRNEPPQRVLVGVLDTRDAHRGSVEEALEKDSRFEVAVLDDESAGLRLRLGQIDLLVVPGKIPEYRYDPTRPDAVHARVQVDSALQRAAGRSDVFEATETPITEPGARYIDFLVPGLLGMNLMSGGMWGVGFTVVDMRSRKLLKRLVASPMRRSEFVGAMMASRIVFMLVEVLLLLGAAYVLFDIVIQGALASALLVGLVGALSFGALGMLVASRAKKIETVSGLMNLVMLPMFVFSGIFFSAERFPDAMQPVIQALPLTMLNDALRAIVIEGASLASQGGEIVGLTAWGAASFALAVRWFRWT